MNEQQTLFDSIINSSQANIGEAVTGFLGTEFISQPTGSKFISKNDLIESLAGQMLVAHISTSSKSQDDLFLILPLKTVIYCGGTLMMLPLDELDKKIANGECGDEDVEAFGEISKIISGIYGQELESFFPGNQSLQLGAVKKLEPSAESLESFFPVDEYYLSSTSITVGEEKLDELWLLTPSNLLSTDSDGTPAEPAASDTPSPSKNPALTLIITVNEVDVEPFTRAMDELGKSCQVISCKDNIKDVLPEEGICGVLLTIGKVDEQAFGVIIKIKSACGEMVPLIAAGSEWTKDTVTKAVECGVNDILLTPVEPEVLKKKIESCFT